MFSIVQLAVIAAVALAAVKFAGPMVGVGA
jgi:hypothetical protein